MANLVPQSLTTAVQNFATAVQGSAAQLIDFTVGSVLRAVAEATAGVALWLQGMILTVLALTRAATSNGSDLDSWFADFGFARLPAVTATTQETFARFTPAAQALIPIGATVQSNDGTAQYVVVVDVTNPAYDASQNGYVIPAGQASLEVPVQCTTAGTVGNVSAGEIGTLGTSIPGVDTVTNANDVNNGQAAEEDAPARARFVLYINSLSKATVAAIMAAILSVQDGISASIIENRTFGGMVQAGLLTVIVDDGTGFPDSTLLANAAVAVDDTRAAGVTFGVFGPTVVGAAVVMAITVNPDGPDKASIVPIVIAALKSNINALAKGAPLPWSRLSGIAYDASPYVTNVTNVTLNGGTADMVVSSVQVIKWSSVVVN